MTTQQAMEMLQWMARGFDPVTGERVPTDHLLNDPVVVRALCMGIEALRGKVASGQGKSPKEAPDTNREWTQEDIAHLAMLHEKGTSMEEMCRMLGRWERDIRDMLASLELRAASDAKQKPKSKASSVWTEQEIEVLKELYRNNVTLGEICEALGRRERGVRLMLISLGLIEDDHEKPAGFERAGLTWLPSEYTLLNELYKQHIPLEEIARQMHRTIYGVFYQMERLGFYGEEYGYPRGTQKEDRRSERRATPVTIDNYNFVHEWDEAQILELRRLANDGMTDEALAEHFAVSINAIRARLVYMGIRKGTLDFVVPSGDPDH